MAGIFSDVKGKMGQIVTHIRNDAGIQIVEAEIIAHLGRLLPDFISARCMLMIHLMHSQ